MTAIKRLIPNLFTAGNLVGGIMAIVFTLTGRIDLAPYCIFASAIFDFLDGFMARLLKVPSELGKQLDSLADMVTFGVAPGLIVFVMLGGLTVITDEFVLPQYAHFPLPPEESLDFLIKQNSWTQIVLPFTGLIIPVFALFRLAKFNLDTRQSDAFIGLPTPAMTLFFAVLPILTGTTFTGVINGEVHTESWEFMLSELVLNPWFLSISAIIMSMLMVVELPLFALKFKHFKWKGNEIRYIFLTLSVLLLATLFFWAIPVIIILYVILSLINTRIAKSETKTNEI